MASPQIAFPDNVCDVIARLKGAGYFAYAVGGCIRDSILGRAPHDWDITTSAKPERIVKIFSEGPFEVCESAGIRHGTVLVKHPSGTVLEVTTYRTEGTYSDHRRPDTVEFTDDIVLDLARRDFTVNAIAAAPLPDGGTEIVDPFNGTSDIERGIIRAVGDAHLRFSEDALRIMRAVRFSSELGFIIDSETLAAAGALAPTLVYISAERITSELWRMLCGKYFRPCREVLDCAVPHICERFYRAFDNALPPRDPYVRLALMFPHKSPALPLTDTLRFPSRIASLVRKLLRIEPPKNIPDVCRLMRDFEEMLPSAAEYIEWLDCADSSAYSGQRLLDCESVIRVRGLPYKPAMLAVRGCDLIAAGVPAKNVGHTLDALVCLATEGKISNERAALTATALNLNK